MAKWRKRHLAQTAKTGNINRIPLITIILTMENILMTFSAIFNTFVPFFAAFVTRTYIGGGGSSNNNNSSLMAMKIHHRKNGSKSQLSLFQNSGSLSSLHETALTSDAEEVRSSVSAYQPISHSKRSSRSRWVKDLWTIFTRPELNSFTQHWFLFSISKTRKSIS